MAESDKGSVFWQEKWLEELDIQKSENATVAASASRSKIQLEDPEEESQLSSTTPSADGTWKTISGRAIASSEKLLEKLDESVSCRFAREESKSWKMQRLSMDLVLSRESSARIKAVRRTRQISVFNSSEKSRAFEIDGPQFLAFEQSAASLSLVLISHWFSASLPTYLSLHENCIVVCKLNDYYACTFTHLNKFCLLSTRGNTELTGSKIIYLPRKFVPVTCYLSKSYC